MKNSEMSVLSWLTEPGKSIRSILLLSILLIPGVAGLLVLPAAKAQSCPAGRNCDSNAVIFGGVGSVNELQNKASNNSDTQTVFRAFGISSTDIFNMDSTAVNGTVTRSGNVIVNGKTVASGAMTAGMQNMSGSTRMTSGSTIFFMRPPSVSFQSSSLPAFVVMKNGQFQFAIIKSCGNPVKATPVVKKTVVKKKPQVVQKVAAAPATRPSVQTQSQTVTVTPPPVVAAAPTAAPAPTPAPTPTVIPNTGAGDVIGFGSLVTLLSGSAHYLYRRSKFGLR
jgi:hypothetical protein